MLTRQQYLHNITDKLAWIKSQIELTNCINLYDLNTHSESFFCGLLNIIYDYSLINLNSREKNFSSIDLADENAKLSIQITSVNTSTKIIKTIEGFIKNKYYEKYDRLVILILGNKKDYTTSFDTQDKFIFSKKNDIIDIEDLIQVIQEKTTSDLQKISNFLDREFSSTPVMDADIDISSAIEIMQRRAAALCRSKLKSAGISHEVASRIIEQDIDSNKFEDVLAAAEQGKNYLVGEFGSGKSHTILILAQRLMRNYLSGDCELIPLFAQAHEILPFGSIQNWAEQKIKSTNYFIFIDGLDEVDYLVSEKIIEEINFLKELWPDSRFIIGSRPMSAIINSNDNYINIQALTDEERCWLFSAVSGESLAYSEQAFLHLDDKLNKLLSKPFFCIIYAFFKAEPRSWAKKDMDLVTVFINKSIEKLKDKKYDVCAQLEQIAILSVNCNLGRVHKTALGTGVSFDDVLRTGFVTLSYDEYLSFPLPIIAQWLAAEGIRHKKIAIDNILCDEATASRWRYPLSILFSQMSYEESLEIFSTIVNKMPGLASIIIRDGIIFGNAEELPSAHKCGTMLRTCMRVWVDALGPLSQYIAPVGKNGLLNLAINVDNSLLTTTWADRENEEGVVELTFEEQTKWFSVINSRGVPMQSTWPWIITFEYLSKRLKEVVESRSILIENGSLEAEHTWSTSLELLGKGSLYEQEIDISATEQYRQYIGTSLIHNGKRIQCDLYFFFIDRLLQKGVTILRAPYPISDKPYSQGGRFVWSTYSKERMLERVRFIYSNALTEYERLIDSYFFTIKNRMPMSSLLPGKFVGYLDFDDSVQDWKGSPSMTWHVEALPSGKSNELIITLDKKSNKDTADLLHAIYHNNITYRPLKRDWINASVHSEILHHFSSTPVTDIVYDWLNNDLKKIGWIKQ
jgi:hypothetical protein